MQIQCLLITVFYKLFIELIIAGMVYIINCPLYGTRVNNKFIPLFTKEECEPYKKYGITRFKGLGELDPDELYEASINPLTRKCIQLKYSDFDLINLWENELGNLKTEVYIS